MPAKKKTTKPRGSKNTEVVALTKTRAAGARSYSAHERRRAMYRDGFTDGWEACAAFRRTHVLLPDGRWTKEIPNGS